MALDRLKALKERAEKAKGFSGDGESPFLSLKDGESVKIRFLQELDTDSEAYDDRRGKFEVIDEHASPKDFKITAKCTAETDGRCWACEQTSNPEIGKKWKPKMRIYANVAVVTEKDGKTPLAEPKVKILKQGFSDKGVGNDIINVIEEFEQLGDKYLKIARSGDNMNNTSYSLMPLGPKPITKAEEELELIPLDKFIKVIPYDEQPAFYMGESGESGGKSEEWLDKAG
jgi:hypothetical protein